MLDLAVCETSLLIVRGKDNIVRAFHNVCRHRGNHIVWHERGHCRNTFTCRFHGWSYATDGTLVGVPDEQNFFDLNKAERGMVQVAAEEWRGFIFINLADAPAQSLEEYLGGAGAALARYPFESMPRYHHYRPEIKVNWKVLIDAQQEGYHVPILHRASLGPSVATLAGGVYRSHSFESYGPHRRSSTPGNPDFVPNPTAALTAKYGAGVVDGFAGEAVAAATEAEIMHGIFDLYVLFPNFVILTLYGTYYTYNVWPLAADRSIWDVRIYYSEPRNAADLFTLEYARVSLRDVLLEDASIHEHVQAGLKNRRLEVNSVSRRRSSMQACIQDSQRIR